MRIRRRAMAVKLSVAEQRLQKILQRAAATKNSGLHGADTAFEDFRDFLVAETFEVAQKSPHCEKTSGTCLQGAAHRHLNFHGRELLERRGAMVFDFNVRAAFFRLGIDGNVFLQMPLEPALVIQRFANSRCGKAKFSKSCPGGNCECPRKAFKKLPECRQPRPKYRPASRG